jgi:hypothetical protein
MFRSEMPPALRREEQRNDSVHSTVRLGIADALPDKRVLKLLDPNTCVIELAAGPIPNATRYSPSIPITCSNRTINSSSGTGSLPAMLSKASLSSSRSSGRNLVVDTSERLG